MKRYRLKSTDESSRKFGPCEVCGQHCTEVFYQVESELFDDDGVTRETYHNCRNLFGHRTCLEGARR